MRIKLAHPRDGHKAGAVIDVPDAEARRLVHEGAAQIAPEKAIRPPRGTSTRSPDPESPDGGTEQKEAAK